MSLTLVIFLILLGLILMLLEVLVIPGIGVAGIAGGVLMVSGVYCGYLISSVHGHIILGSSLLSSGLILYLALQRKTWNKLTLHTEISGKASVNPSLYMKPGDLGETITRLNPSGKAVINGEVWEVTSLQDFMAENQSVEVVSVEVNKIFVQSSIKKEN